MVGNLHTWLYNSIEKQDIINTFKQAFQKWTEISLALWQSKYTQPLLGLISLQCHLPLVKRTSPQNEHVAPALFPFLLFEGTCKFTQFLYSFFRNGQTFLSQQWFALTFTLRTISYLLEAVSKSHTLGYRHIISPSWLPKWLFQQSQKRFI